MINKVELVLDAKAIAGENPNWNQEEKSLFKLFITLSLEFIL